MEVAEYCAAPSHPGRGRVKLSLEALDAGSQQVTPRSRNRLSPSRRRSKHRASSFEEVLVDEWDMLRDAAATVIQAAWRGYQAREWRRAQYHAAVTIQAAWRGFCARQQVASQWAEVPAWQGYGASGGPFWAPPELDEEQAATMIQAHYRGYRARQELAARHRAATAIQPHWQGYRASGGPFWAPPELDEEQAATAIQAHYRGYQARQELAASHRAAATIQAHWRGYQARQALAQGRAIPHSSSSRQEFFNQTYQGLLDYVTGEPPAPGPTSLVARRHAQAGAQSRPSFCTGQPGEHGAGGERLPKPPGLVQRGGRVPPACKTCPQCGRSTMVRVLVGVGRGTAHQSAASLAGHHYHEPPPPRQAATGPCSARREGTSVKQPWHSAGHGHAQPARAGHYHMARAEGAAHKGHQPWTGPPPAGQRGAEDWAAHTGWRQGRGHPLVAQTTPCCGEWGRDSLAGARATLYRSAALSPPIAALQAAGGVTHAAPLPSSGWSRQAQAKQRAFKTRKQHWQLVRAATLIQAFWRGCQARRALREQQKAAVRIQSAFRGHRTRTYLCAEGILSGAELEEEEVDGAWSCQWGQYR